MQGFVTMPQLVPLLQIAVARPCILGIQKQLLSSSYPSQQCLNQKWHLSLELSLFSCFHMEPEMASVSGAESVFMFSYWSYSS